MGAKRSTVSIAIFCVVSLLAAQKTLANDNRLYLGIFLQERPGLSLKLPFGDYGAAHVAFSGAYRHEAVLDLDWQLQPPKDSLMRVNVAPLWVLAPYVGIGVRQTAHYERGRQESLALRAPVGFELLYSSYSARGFGDLSFISSSGDTRQASAWSARVGLRTAF